jgi:hypothetical protein
MTAAVLEVPPLDGAPAEGHVAVIDAAVVDRGPGPRQQGTARDEIVVDELATFDRAPSGGCRDHEPTPYEIRVEAVDRCLDVLPVQLRSDEDAVSDGHFVLPFDLALAEPYVGAEGSRPVAPRQLLAFLRGRRGRADNDQHAQNQHRPLQTSRHSASLNNAAGKCADDRTMGRRLSTPGVRLYKPPQS